MLTIKPTLAYLNENAWFIQDNKWIGSKIIFKEKVFDVKTENEEAKKLLGAL
jgi:hypothetical protein